MPALTPTLLLGTSNLFTNNTSPANTTNSAVNGLQVICAWPVSGQYGPGSRVLYYVLILACVLARKAEWIKNACLAAALLLPAVAAVHGIVLAALHRDDAVDMDIYGAFQLCSIGILAAPVTVRLSRTYFNDPGRNTIFLWVGLILAGLLSLTIEFYRINTVKCMVDDFGHPLPADVARFPFGNAKCGLTCSTEEGPFSPMRGGAANNVYVIPAPNRLTFGAATLMAAACCVHAILWLVSMMDKILEINWKSRFGMEDEHLDEPIEGTNGATKGDMKSVNDKIKFFFSVVAVPVFGGAGLAILIIGERNFFSPQVAYEIEPLASVGQWAPIVGTAMAAMGSLYLLLAKDVEAAREEKDPNAVHHCKCSHHHLQQLNSPGLPVANHYANRRSLHSIENLVADNNEMVTSPGIFHNNSALSITSSHPRSHSRPSNDLMPTMTHYSSATSRVRRENGSRRKVAKMLMKMGDALGAAKQEWRDDSDFKRGKASNFPEVPGELYRNGELPKIRKSYNPPRDPDGNATPLPRSRSRASSFVGNVASVQGIEGVTHIRRATSPRPMMSPASRSESPTPPSPRVTKQRANTMPATMASSELHHTDSQSSSGLVRGRRRARRDTLEVPPLTHHNPLRIYLSQPADSSAVTSGEQQSASPIEDSYQEGKAPSP